MMDQSKADKKIYETCSFTNTTIKIIKLLANKIQLFIKDMRSALQTKGEKSRDDFIDPEVASKKWNTNSLKNTTQKESTDSSFT
jgi:hypothetical protein